MNIILTSKDSTNPYSRAAQYFFQEIKKLAKAQDTIYCALAGGTSVGKLFREIINNTDNLDISIWSSIIWCVADERVVDSNSPELNYNTIYGDFLELLIEKQLISKESTFQFDFTKLNYLKKYSLSIPRIDVTILSSGEDGHVGSLYPNHESIKDESFKYIDVFNSPKPPAHRVSASKKMLSSAKVSFTIFKGEGKREAYSKFKDSSVNLNECPVKLVKENEKSYIIVDIGE